MNQAKIQIISAVIWAITIITCGWMTDKSHVSTILITAAGLHVILMSRLARRRESQ